MRRRHVLLPLLVLLACIAARVPYAVAAHGHHGHAKHARVVHRHARHKHRVRHHRHVVRHHERAVRHLTRVVRERASLVRYARRFLGIPYVYGGVSPGSGFDCSGFTRYVYAHFGVSLPHYTFSQFDLGRRVARAALAPGDLVFFDGVGHVGLYIGHNLFIHAPHTGTRVSVSSMSGWYSGAFVGARRLIS